MVGTGKEWFLVIFVNPVQYWIVDEILQNQLSMDDLFINMDDFPGILILEKSIHVWKNPSSNEEYYSLF